MSWLQLLVSLLFILLNLFHCTFCGLFRFLSVLLYFIVFHCVLRVVVCSGSTCFVVLHCILLLLVVFLHGSVCFVEIQCTSFLHCVLLCVVVLFLQCVMLCFITFQCVAVFNYTSSSFVVFHCVSLC